MKSCLVVDDSRIVRKVARRIIEDLGFQCAEAVDGQDAWDSCQSKMPDAVLLNWNMPRMNGIEFLEKLRQLPNGKTPKVVFCTTEGSPDKIAHALKTGANEYIVKPFDNEIIKVKFTKIGLIS